MQIVITQAAEKEDQDCDYLFPEIQTPVRLHGAYFTLSLPLRTSTAVDPSMYSAPWACGRGQRAAQSAVSGVGTRRLLLASSVRFSSLMSALASVPENEFLISSEIWGKCAHT